MTIPESDDRRKGEENTSEIFMRLESKTRCRGRYWDPAGKRPLRRREDLVDKRRGSFRSRSGRIKLENRLCDDGGWS